MAETKIEWADYTFNPWIGCTKVSPACDNCYAERWGARFGVEWGSHPRYRTSNSYWSQPLKWNRKAAVAGVRKRVFCASLADWLDNQVDPSWRRDLAFIITDTPNLDWLLLSKRPQNYAELAPWMVGDPPPNVSLGTTVENQQEANRRIPEILRWPAKWHFISAEPLLGPINLEQIQMARGRGTKDTLTGEARIYGNIVSNPSAAIDWVICGGESGPGARPMHPDWARSLRDQCAAAGVPFFFKQMGEWQPAIDRDRDDPDWRRDYAYELNDARRDIAWLNLGGGRGFHGERFHIMRRVGKARAGRMLDGTEYSEFPI